MVNESTAALLQAKVRKQAAELVGLTEALQHQVKYSKLVESRLLEIHPGHPLPVTRGHLGQQSLQRSLTSDVSQRELQSLIGEVSTLRKGYDEARHKLAVSTRTVKDLRLALQTKDRDARAAEQRSASVSGELKALERRAAEASEAQANLALLEAEVRRLRRELGEARQSGEESRLQVQALRSSLEIRAEELGLHGGQAGILEQLSEVRQEATLAIQEANARRQLQGRLEAELALSREETAEWKHKLSCEVRDSARVRDKFAELQRGEENRMASVLSALQQDKKALLDHVQDLSQKLTQNQGGEDALRRSKVALADTLDELERVSKELTKTKVELEERNRAIREGDEERSALRRELELQSVNVEEMSLMHMEALRSLSQCAKNDADVEALKKEAVALNTKNAALERQLVDSGPKPQVQLLLGLEKDIDDLKKQMDVLEEGGAAVPIGMPHTRSGDKDAAGPLPIWQAVQKDTLRRMRDQHPLSQPTAMREPRFMQKLRMRLHRAQADLARLRG